MQQKVVHSLNFHTSSDQCNDDHTIAQYDEYEDHAEYCDLEFGQRRISIGLLLISGVCGNEIINRRLIHVLERTHNMYLLVHRTRTCGVLQSISVFDELK